jgi:maleate isomerase
MSTWKPDGSGWRARLGVLTHDDSAISESELWTMAPDGVSLHTSRVFFADLATFADPPGPDNATELLARLPLQAIIYAWTVGSYLLGTTGEEELVPVLNSIQMAFPSSCRRPRQRQASGRWKPNESR